MSVPGFEAARAAVQAARVAIISVDPSKHAEDLAADLLEAWSEVEGALRVLLEGSHSTGVELIREARNRQLLGFDQANALAGFLAVRDRTRETGYEPTVSDLNAARLAMSALDGALDAFARGPDLDVTAPVEDGDFAVDREPDGPPVSSMTPPGMRTSPIANPRPVRLPRERSTSHTGLWIFVVLLLLAGGGAAYYWYGGPRRDALMGRAISEFDAGQLDAATIAFRRVLQVDPTYAIAHVYLARIARNTGNMPAANEELQLAITADPTSSLALREMGAYLFTAGDYELARKFYVRAVSADPENEAAMGYLGCTLVKLGRVDEGERWITRAGPGVWTSCVAAGSQ
ncbi:MAG TPA: tetratricopeptide repeat protein [Gemmatimonadaceae bacterium]|nr:tetratricopeptide repeat protein [Gemmatimonadaceae bacterium]